MSDFCVAKWQIHPLSGKSSVVPLTFRREIVHGSHSGINMTYQREGELAFGNTEVTHVVPRWSEIWRFVPGLTVSLILFSLQACDGGDFEKFRKVSSFLMQGCTSRDKLIDD